MAQFFTIEGTVSLLINYNFTHALSVSRVPQFNNSTFSKWILPVTSFSPSL